MTGRHNDGRTDCQEIRTSRQAEGQVRQTGQTDNRQKGQTDGRSIHTTDRPTDGRTDAKTDIQTGLTDGQSIQTRHIDRHTDTAYRQGGRTTGKQDRRRHTGQADEQTDGRTKITSTEYT